MFSSCERGGEGREKPIMGRPCVRAHRCVRLSQTKNLLNNLCLQWRKQNAVTPISQTRPFRHGDAVTDLWVPFRRVPRHRSHVKFTARTATSKGKSGRHGSAPDW
ncbi:hypothetical protein EVAR_20938_1 [Eumeta japonica]|uniref:Uncharacterized protein n=1 Tax=Eumeta variegata TaxID=151549 RepID=A0A4C1UVL8_EUMVA|nr:hypothetical protein EVAR_20938_1 [Eumeta japonica]